MAELIRAKLTDIHFGDREREIDEDYARWIGASIAEHGQISPILVRRTPAANKGKTPLTLVVGGHRTRGAILHGLDELDAIVVGADTVDASMLELVENIYRNDLSKLDRAMFVMKYRELWEKKHGKISRGGDQKSKGNDYHLIFAGGREMSVEVARRMGVSSETIKLANRIAQNLHPALRTALRGTTAADDQSLLLKLAKKGPSEQAGIAVALQAEPNIKKVMSSLKGEQPKADPQEAAFGKLVAAWKAANEDTRRRFLAHVGDSQDFSFLEAAE